jgi:hypothetical protein
MLHKLLKKQIIKYSNLSNPEADILIKIIIGCVHINPEKRLKCKDLIKMLLYFTNSNYREWYTRTQLQ